MKKDILYENVWYKLS